MTAAVAFFAFTISRVPFTTVSPDSIRFMHFAQINVDRAAAEGGSVKSNVLAVLRAVKGMDAYDFHRGRVVQAFAYELDGTTRRFLPFATLNLLMILLLSLNAGLAALLATRHIVDSQERLDAGLLSWLVLLTTSLIVSPVMLLILYGKYLWVTFIFGYFAARRTRWKVFWLIPAAFSDEIGLAAVALIVMYKIARVALQSPTVRATSPRRALLWGAIAAINVVFAFYGLIALVFDAGAGAFTGFVRDALRNWLEGALEIMPFLHGMAWRSEVVFLGRSTGNIAVMSIAGAIGLTLIVLAIRKRMDDFRRERSSSGNSPTRLRALLIDHRLSYYAFWGAMVTIIGCLILPDRGEDLTHYSYPAGIAIGLLLLTAMFELLPARRAALVLAGVLAIHLVMLPNIIDSTARKVQAYLLPDGTVTASDIAMLNRSIEEIRHGKGASTFAAMDNKQELDFTFTWYYSRVKWFGNTTVPHWPVRGTARVLAWPTRLPPACVGRQFYYTRPEFIDVPCPKSKAPII